jgi:hypothetical protein
VAYQAEADSLAGAWRSARAQIPTGSSFCERERLGWGRDAANFMANGLLGVGRTKNRYLVTGTQRAVMRTCP